MFVFVASEDEDVNERIVKVYNTCKNETWGHHSALQ